MEEGGSASAAADGDESSALLLLPPPRRSHSLLFRHLTPPPLPSGGGSSGISLLLGRATAAMRRAPLPPSSSMEAAAALRLEERRADWGYSRPIVTLDIVWNLAFVLIAASVLLATPGEKPPTPIRAWVFGYAVQCLVHAGFVWAEYRRRRGVRGRRAPGEYGWGEGDYEEDEMDELTEVECPRGRIMKKLESANAVISFLWWILGFYWIVAGGQTLLQDAPHLYWLTVVFLAFDVFFAIFCILLACFIGIALCCCLPCIIAILYAVAGQEGASDADLSALPRFRYCHVGQSETFNQEHASPVSAMELNSQKVNDLVLSPEDSECCICLAQYEDGVELLSLPCNHHFHTGCIAKWLRINATCPLCKYNIRRGDEQV